MTESLFPGVFSRRARGVELSPIAAAGARAARLAAEGRSIVVLTSGEPDFDTPQAIKDAAALALAQGQTKYTPTAGTAALRRAVADGHRQRHGLPTEAANVIISNGGKQVIYLALAATLDEGDEVIVPTPYWPTFLDSVRVNGGTPVLAPTAEADGFKLTPQGLRQALTARTKWLILNSPGNPSGAVYSEAELAALAAVLREHPSVLVLWDEMYEQIWFEQAPAHLLRAAPDLAGRTLAVNGVSKAYAMTGWRVGFGGGPVELIKAMNLVQSQSTSHTSSISQAASVAALDGPMDFLPTFVEAFRRRRDLVVGRLNAIDGLACDLPPGAFYAFPSCQGLLGRRDAAGQLIATDADLALYLLREAGVAIVPGSAFELPGHFRVSYAASDAELDEAMARIAAACARLC